MPSSAVASRAESALLLDGYRAANRVMGPVLLAHVAASGALAFLHGTWWAFAVGAAIGLTVFGLVRAQPDALASRMAVGVGLMGFSGVFIHQAHGLIEAHFHVFVALAVLLIYRDWKVIVAAAGTIAVHHVAGHVAQQVGWGLFVLNHHGGFGIILLHAAFVVAETAMVAYIAHTLAEEARESTGIVTVATAFSAGDLAVEVTGTSPGAAACRQVATTLRAVSDEVQAAAGDVAAGRPAKRHTTVALGGAYGAIVAGVHAAVDSAYRNAETTRQEQGFRAELLDALREALAQVEKRDLTARMRTDWSGSGAEQAAVLATTFNRVVAQLSDALGEVRASAEQVTGAATQIADGADGLAQGTGQQASSLEEIAASVKTLGQVAQQNATSAGEAQKVSEQTRSATTDGYTKMQQLLGAMADMKASAESTAKIVKTIDEIAFQTNLLALNAAVEAARAGDAGRGFAVVAEEVRALAKRSADAARNTSALIDESVRRVFSGEGLTKQVYQQLDEVRQRVNALGDVMAEIGRRSEEQRAGVGQIDQAIEMVNGAVQQAAANAEESASAAQELTAQARSQLELVGGFRLDAAGASTGATAGVTRPAGHVSRPTPALVKAVPARGAAPLRSAPLRPRTGTPRHVPAVTPRVTRSGPVGTTPPKPTVPPRPAPTAHASAAASADDLFPMDDRDTLSSF
jgi:methyl-accepting chemotaxis protein